MNMPGNQKFIALLRIVKNNGFHYYEGSYASLIQKSQKLFLDYAKIRRFSRINFAFRTIYLKDYDLKECKVII
jgi:hypothetical protein